VEGQPTSSERGWKGYGSLLLGGGCRLERIVSLHGESEGMRGRTATVGDMSGFGFCGNGVVVRCFRHGSIVVGEKESGAISWCGGVGGVGY
jgi:hypothetical protein